MTNDPDRGYYQSGFGKNIQSREAQLFVGWVSGSVTHAGVGFHASTQPTFILYLIPPTHLVKLIPSY
ncbi:MAG: hypothetical protein EWV88_07545 [Microcystis wesenbergii Mw_MB_S_20031200_S109D]|uniref:Uncharacterized protein n=1 Tax=Microcystis wesenbergii Mw_MB_S_20031200_S109D TaxID=2486241 RepID=A0A552LZI6_9CHRO|nr:MAG: hypothetical protein EWV88_07545 [Microcystis wesenbergii Mw_MB_S_20031200_S109D]